MKPPLPHRFWPPCLQRTAGVGLLLVQSVALAVLLQDHVIAGLAGVIALGGWLLPADRWRLRIRPQLVFFAILCLLIVKYTAAPRKLPPELKFIRTELAYEVAVGCILTQLSVLFMAKWAVRLPFWFATVSGLGLIATCDIRTDESLRTIMLILVGIFFALLGLFASSSRKVERSGGNRGGTLRAALLAAVLLVASVSGAAASELLYRYQHQLDRMVNHYLIFIEPRIARAGFSGLGGLSDVSHWQRAQGETIALRIVCDFCPEYLRGRTFDYFSEDLWHATDPGRRVGPSLATGIQTRGRDDDNTFLLRRMSDQPLSLMEVWPIDVETAGHCFLPLQTAALLCPSLTLHVDDSLIAQRPSGDFASSYAGLLAAEVPAEQIGIRQQLCLKLPDSLDPRISGLAENICRNATTSREKMEAVQHFFQQNFQYQWGIQIPPGEDPLTYFLIERPPAHCEYFATGTALLLRAVGVPARYVTGFVVSEQSGLDNKWIARRRDSHAWVEAYDEQAGHWVIVESTPYEGIPASNPPQVSKQFQEILAYQLLRLQELLASGTLWRWAAMCVGWGVIAVALGYGMLTLWKSLKFARRRRPAVTTLEESLKRLVEERKRMDQFLAARGIRRVPAQTLLQFAQQIEQTGGFTGAASLANWYRDYVVLRFRADTVDESAVASIRAAREEASRSLRRIV